MTVEDSYEDIDAQFTLSLKVENNKAIYSFEDITNDGDANIEKIEFADMNLISADSSQSEAQEKLANISNDITKQGDTDDNIDSSLDNLGTSSGHYMTYFTTGEL